MEAVRKARLCTLSLKFFTDLKMKKKKTKIVVLPLMCGWQRYVLLEKILNSPPCCFCKVLTTVLGGVETASHSEFTVQLLILF